MQKTILLILVFFIGTDAFCGDSLFVTRKQKGVLLLSYYNYRYDRQASGNVITELSYPDIFLPISGKINYKNLAENVKAKTIKDGIIISSYFKERIKLKEQAGRLYCKDTSGCYPFDFVYIIPVEITYKEYKNKAIAPCGVYFLRLWIDELSGDFFYRKNDITLIRVKEMKSVK